MTAASAGGTVSETAMAKLFSDLSAELTTDHTTLSPSQLNDLETIAADLNVGETASPYVTYITDALIDGNAANAKWTGGGASTTTLGNLTVGSTATQVDELDGKWFLGTDLPSSTVHMSGYPTFKVSYSAVTSPVFGATGPSMNDINQGYLGDCYLLASLAEVAYQNPSLIQSMITSDGNNTYGIRFFVDGSAEYVTVNNSLADGGTIFNNATDIWASLVEKAYAQIQASGIITGNTVNDGNSFSTIGNGGFPEDALEEITGASSITDFDASGSSWSQYVYNDALATQLATLGLTTASVLATLISDLAEGNDAVLSSETNATASNGMDTLIADHAMSIYGYDSTTGDLEIRNPWGTESGQYWETTFEVSLAALLADGDTISVDNMASSSSGTIVSNGQTSAVTAGSPSTGWIVLSGGTMNVSVGGVISGAVDSGGSDVILSGGTALGTLVSSGGVENVSSGGTAIGTILYSGGAENVFAGGTVSGLIFSGGTQNVCSGAVVNGTTLSGGTVKVLSGGSAGDLTVASGGLLKVLSSGNAEDLTVSSGGLQYVYGSAAATSVGNGGIEEIFAGGTDSGAIVSSGGVQYDSGTANGGTLSSGGVQYVYSGGAANATTIVSGGIEDILSGGAANGAVVSSGGTEFDFGTASGGTLSGGVQYVYASALAGTVASGGVEDILSGGAANGGIVSSGGTQFDFGTASGGTLSSGGVQYVYGSAAAGTVASGGLEDILSGGSASGGTVSSGGTEFDFGTASGVALSGGLQYVYGSAAAATIASGGIEDIIAGGTASGVTVSGGHQYVYGSAAATTLSSGGHEIVYSGGTISGATIAGGTLELQGGSTAGSSTIGFASSGTLKLDGTGSYAMLVAGFTVPDAIDLTAVNYASATTLSYTSNTSGGTLTVTDGTHSVSLLLLGNYSAANFSLSSGSTGTIVSDPPTGVTTDLTPIALVTIVPVLPLLRLKFAANNCRAAAATPNASRR